MLAVDLSVEDAPPTGFDPLIGSPGGYDALTGPFYVKLEDGNPLVGMRLAAKHLNASGICHGGVIALLADYQAVAARYLAGMGDRTTPTVTISVDMMAPAPAGSWLTLRCQLLRQTRNLLFSAGHIEADGELVARVDGIFKIGKPAPERPTNNGLHAF